MSRVYLVIMLVAMFLLALSLTPLRLRLQYRRQGKNDDVALEISLWRGLICYKLRIPVMKMEKRKIKPKFKSWKRPLLWPVLRPAFKLKTEISGKGGRSITAGKKKITIPGPVRMMGILSDILREIKRYYPAIIYLLGRVHLRRFQWQTEIGAGDPAPTGFLVGMAWGMKGLLLTLFYRLFSPGGARPVVAVTPSFEKACFNTMLDCIFEVRIGYIMLTGFKALFLRFNKNIGG